MKGRRGAGRWGALAALVLTLAHSRVVAASPAARHRVEVSLNGCDGAAFALEQVVELLRVELSAFDVRVVAEGALGVPTPSEPSPTETISRVTLTVGAEVSDPGRPCDPNATDVNLRVDQAPFAAPAAQRRLEVSDVAPANRARTLAIAAAELLQATWSHPTVGAESGVSKPSAAVSSTLPSKATPARTVGALEEGKVQPVNPGVWIEAGALVRAFPSGGSALLGPELGLSIPLVSVLTLNLGGELSSGLASLPFDDANGAASSVSLRTATFSLGPSLRSVGKLALEVGPRLALGQGWVASRFGGSKSEGPLVLVSFDAVLRANLLAGWATFAGIEIGRSVSGVALEVGESALSLQSVELAGVLVGARVGLSFALTQRR